MSVSKEPSEELAAKWDAAQRALFEAVMASRREMGEDSDRGLLPDWFVNLLNNGPSIFEEIDEPSEDDWFKGIN
jgi:hypothetical protein